MSTVNCLKTTSWIPIIVLVKSYVLLGCSKCHQFSSCSTLQHFWQSSTRLSWPSLSVLEVMTQLVIACFPTYKASHVRWHGGDPQLLSAVSPQVSPRAWYLVLFCSPSVLGLLVRSYYGMGSCITAMLLTLGLYFPFIPQKRTSTLVLQRTYYILHCTTLPPIH